MHRVPRARTDDPGRPRRLALLCLTMLAAAAAPLRAQQPGEPTLPQGEIPATPETRTVAGRVVTPRGEQPAPVPGVMVTLHRVGRDTAGPVDSMRTGGDGAYRFRYRTFGAADAIYFVSASYSGIAYFSPPLRGPRVSGDDAEITVFDTTSKSLGLTTRGRHLVVSTASVGGRKDAGTERTVIEVYELSNDSTRTIVSGQGKGEHATWTATLPEGARDFRVGQGDVSADAVSFTNGRVLVFAPIAPGLKQVAFTYTLPAKAFPLSIPVEQPAQIFEVLLEDPRGSAEGPGMKRVDPVSVEGRAFNRFLASDVPANSVLRVTFPGTTSSQTRTLAVLGIALVVGIAMLIGRARAFMRRVQPTTIPRLREDDPDELARAIATLDADFERETAPSDELREGYRRRREMLKERLTDALARRGTRR